MGLPERSEVEAKRPATFNSIRWWQNQLDLQGGTGHFTSLVEYRWGDLLKVFFDIDIKSATPPDVAVCKRMIVEEVLKPFFRFVYATTGVMVDMGSMACSDDTCKTDEGYKFSMHIFINNVVCSAQTLKHLHALLNFPDWVDTKPYDINGPESTRLLRLLGASKIGSNSYMKPCSSLGRDLVHPPPLQDYIVTCHDGNEVDITETLVDPAEQPSTRPRRADADVALPVREAAFLSQGLHR